MKFKSLDEKREGESACILVSASLASYIESIPEDYDNYEIQRSIVNNTYLDKLVETVLMKGHIPSITLIAPDEFRSGDSRLVNFKILDGLQRTYRLKSIYETKNLFINEIEKINLLSSEFKVKREFRDQLKKIKSNSIILMAIKRFYDKNGKEKLEECFKNNYQWFEIWRGLSPDDEVRKMLILNAGHKQVNIKHQLELLFRSILPKLESVKREQVKIIREKEVPSRNFSKERSQGEYHFSHLISALVSLIEKKPVTTNTDFISKIQDSENQIHKISEFLSYNFLDSFMSGIYELDARAHRTIENTVAQKWFGREVSLVSLFAAIGNNCEHEKDFQTIIKNLLINFDRLNLEEHEKCRNSVDLAKVNLGAVNRSNIFSGVDYFIKNGMSENINWKALYKDDINE